MKIAVLGAGRVGSTVGRLWHAAGHDVTFAPRRATRPRALAAELGERAHAASVADAVAGAEVVFVAVPGPVVTDVLQAAGPLDGRICRARSSRPGSGRSFKTGGTASGRHSTASTRRRSPP
jgi:predicted dinucleotide-binding enzyme